MKRHQEKSVVYVIAETCLKMTIGIKLKLYAELFGTLNCGSCFAIRRPDHQGQETQPKLRQRLCTGFIQDHLLHL